MEKEREDGLEDKKHGFSILDRPFDREKAAQWKPTGKSICRKPLVEKPKFKTDKPNYCVVCGEAIHHTTETAAAWVKIRRCVTCKTENRSGSEKRFCRVCGVEHTMDSAGSHKDGWKTWATCDSCK